MSTTDIPRTAAYFTVTVPTVPRFSWGTQMSSYVPGLSSFTVTVALGLMFWFMSSSLTVKELELQPGWEGRLHTHPTDIAVMVMAGAIQMIVGDEIRTVRAGSTLLAPPGVPHKLINELWMPAQLLAIYPTTELETTFLE